MAFLVFFLLFLSLTGHSSGLYCVCKDGVSDQILQKAIDYACGTGADCTPILQNGPCFQPNTVKDHCNYAVNSYYQRKGNVQGSCDFAGAAAPSQTPPTTSSGCVYPSIPGAGTTPSTGSPGSTPGTGTGTGTGTTAGSPNVFGMSPTSTIGGNGDPSSANMKSTNTILLLSLVLTMCLAFMV
ncbi:PLASMODESMATA CALLOSE-BINDING PROTEIN 1 isoform X2 [Cicer arietinum]|uniref:PLASMODESMATA CALLOSE-BINDING PROTEIN 4 isoform X2 n=1 Tax=Cicer arietinum TaxID=3827 RepID=A0A1S2YJ55_CICAR|nr:PLASMODESMATA CALLOSE-BINDING PROTEIN 4 isoform X2 [Cicer arietinum]